MRVLALETSSDRCSVALWSDGAIAERAADGRNAHSELILPLVDDLLAAAGVRLKDLTGIAFGAGPGGFTGLRLACGVAQGLGYGAERPVIGVGSLEALALASGHGRVYACLDARMSEFYCAAYRVEGDAVRSAIDPLVAPAARLPLPEQAGWWGCGSGFAHPEVAARLGPALEGMDPAAVPTASAVARLAAARFAAGQAGEAARAAPLYVRDRVAQTSAERRAAGGRG